MRVYGEFVNRGTVVTVRLRVDGEWYSFTIAEPVFKLLKETEGESIKNLLINY